MKFSEKISLFVQKHKYSIIPISIDIFGILFGACFVPVCAILGFISFDDISTVLNSPNFEIFVQVIMSFLIINQAYFFTLDVMEIRGEKNESSY